MIPVGAGPPCLAGIGGGPPACLDGTGGRFVVVAPFPDRLGTGGSVAAPRAGIDGTLGWGWDLFGESWGELGSDGVWEPCRGGTGGWGCVGDPRVGVNGAGSGETLGGEGSVGDCRLDEIAEGGPLPAYPHKLKLLIIDTLHYSKRSPFFIVSGLHFAKASFPWLVIVGEVGVKGVFHPSETVGVPIPTDSQSVRLPLRNLNTSPHIQFNSIQLNFFFGIRASVNCVPSIWFRSPFIWTELLL